MTILNSRRFKTLKDNPNDLPWDDIQVAVATGKLPASHDPTWTTYNFGIGGGLAFSVLGWAIDDYLDLYIQTSHMMGLKTVFGDHIHYVLPTAPNAGDQLAFQLDVIGAGIGDPWRVPDHSPYTIEWTLEGNENTTHCYHDIADIEPINTTVSTLYVTRITRINASVTDYGGEVYIIYNDGHYQKESDGSYFEGGLLDEGLSKNKGKSKNPFKPGAR